MALVFTNVFFVFVSTASLSVVVATSDRRMIAEVTGHVQSRRHSGAGWRGRWNQATALGTNKRGHRKRLPCISDDISSTVFR